MMQFSEPTNHKRMRRLRYLKPGDRLTVCGAIRDVYAEIEDEGLLKKLRYAENLAHEMALHIERIDPGWLKALYPKRREYEKIMDGI